MPKKRKIQFLTDTSLKCLKACIVYLMWDNYSIQKHGIMLDSSPLLKYNGSYIMKKGDKL